MAWCGSGTRATYVFRVNPIPSHTVDLNTTKLTYLGGDVAAGKRANAFVVPTFDLRLVGGRPMAPRGSMQQRSWHGSVR